MTEEDINLDALKKAVGGKGYTLLNEVGRGNKGVVYKISSKKENELFALKVLETVDGKGETEALELFDDKRGVVHMAHHFTFGHETIFTCIVLEWAEKNLGEQLEQSQRLSPDEFDNLYSDLFAGLRSIHGATRLHCDIKPENLGVFHDGSRTVYRLLDLGSLVDADKHRSADSTRRYCAPERIGKSALATKKSDLYEAGATLLAALGWKPKSDERPHEAVERTFKELSRSTDWAGADPDELKAAMSYLLQEEPESREKLENAESKFNSWTKHFRKNDKHKQAKIWKPLAVAITLISVAALAYGVSEWSGSTDKTEPLATSNNAPTEGNGSEQPEIPFGQASIDVNNVADALDPVIIVISGASESSQFTVAHANSLPQFARSLNYDPSLPPNRRHIPTDLWAGAYHVLCEDYPEYSSEITIAPHVSAIEIHTGKIRESGEAGLVANTTATITVRGRNMPDSLALYMGDIQAHRYEVSKRNGDTGSYSNNGDKFRSTPESIYFMLKVPNRVGMESLQVYLTADDFQNGNADALTESVELYSIELDELISLSEQIPDYYLHSKDIGTPAGIVVVEQWAESIKMLTTQCRALEKTGLVLPQDVADKLIANLEHWAALVHLSMSSRSVKYKYKNVKALRSMYDKRVRNLNHAIIAWSELAKVSDNETIALKIRQLESVQEFFTWMLKGEEPVKPYMKAISISSSTLVEKEDILSAIGLGSDSSIADRKKKLDECISSGEVWFKFHLRVKNFNNELKTYKSNGRSFSSIAVPHSVEINKTRFKIEFDKSKSKWPLKWELGDTVEVEVRVHWRRTEYLVTEDAGEESLMKVKFTPAKTVPFGYTFSLLSSRWSKTSEWQPIFDKDFDAIPLRLKKPSASMKAVVSPRAR